VFGPKESYQLADLPEKLDGVVKIAVDRRLIDQERNATPG
jgi:hypothetical protein